MSKNPKTPAEHMVDSLTTFQQLSEVEEVDVATAPKEEVWHDGKVKLYRFQNDNVTSPVPLMITYALVNRPDMMDLQPDRSVIRRLLDHGIDVYLIDWGYANRADRYKTMDDYINGYMDDAVDFIREKHQLEKIHLLGVCQGGTFSVIYSALYPEKVQSLITMVTPIEFDVKEGLLFRWSKAIDVDAIVDGCNGVVPGDFLNMGFDLMKPLSKVRKYTGLPKMLENKDRLMNFLRMEKWVADSPDQPGETYRQFIKDLFQQNKLVKGELKVGNKKVDLKKVQAPLLNIFAKDDHIVPPESTKPLNDYVDSKDAQTYEFPGGHIGVFVGSRSQKDLSPTIANWLKERS
jgi:polyhydroxyalkanoate synthase